MQTGWRIRCSCLQSFRQNWTGGDASYQTEMALVIPEFQWTSNVDFELFMDACGSGFGAFWQGAWFTGEFTDWARSEGMAFKELFAITMAVATWYSQWRGKKSGSSATTRQFAICFTSRILRGTI